MHCEDVRPYDGSLWEITNSRQSASNTFRERFGVVWLTKNQMSSPLTDQDSAQLPSVTHSEPQAKGEEPR